MNDARPGAGSAGYLPIASYGVIGNLRTTALVGTNGSIDWCCLPNSSCPSVFASLLDARKGGRFAVSLLSETSHCSQSYVEGTNVLETHLYSSTGCLTLCDFMELSGNLTMKRRTLTEPAVYRIIRSVGSNQVRVEWSPRPDYGRAGVRIEREKGEFVARSTGGEIFWLEGLRGRTWVETRGGQATLFAEMGLRDGQELCLTMHMNCSPVSGSFEGALEARDETISCWRAWLRDEAGAQREWAGKWRDHLVRSELVLKLLTNGETGAIIAAPTTSLPELIGGERNWDYRYAWIRDASLTAKALASMQHVQAARDFLHWVHEVTLEGEKRKRIQVVYGPFGEVDLAEHTLGHLEGYRRSAPVRVGNSAYRQKQLDVFGEILDSAHQLLRGGEFIPAALQPFLTEVANRAALSWLGEDLGIWEFRDRPRHFTYSKLMVWVALLRAVELGEGFGLNGEVAYWRHVAGVVRETILNLGYSPTLKSFVQAFDSEHLDASSLMLPLRGLVSMEDARAQGTIRATLERLTERGLVRRYSAPDGLEGSEGAFLLCTFWLVDALALSGRLQEAWDIFEGAAARANHLRLLPEQIDPSTGEFLGNFPQGFSHIGLINSLNTLRRAEGGSAGVLREHELHRKQSA
ncbi:MAG: hypothetical protein A2428_10250 [Bdellovibrionales bacterium RIFOXYC1_FULL_54_43]|nr:MAG: hypothetical protein A2428_10250 [Bdellovibrionales bacterium RIFOXYC1_FULL_54_43]OFZ80500.1 MAG: hypothetical protein A2603_13005 [Bdellovibrionales bacterium RIFOXYD1_FULL_55_31]